MKTTLSFLIALLGFSTSFATLVQDGGKSLCKSFFPIEEGTTLSYENFNSKDKLQSIDYLTVNKVIQEDARTVIEVSSAVEDKKGEKTESIDITYTCENGTFSFSLSSKLDPEMLEAYKDMEVQMEDGTWVIPAELNVGMDLPDCSMKMNVLSNGIKIISLTINVTDRKVEALEKIETNAGSFEAYKMIATTTVKTGFLSTTSKSIDWMTENIGAVRSESYDKKGKLSSYRVLKDIKK